MTGAERFLAACRGEPVDATPVWFMRQSGGSLPAYLALRERLTVVEIVRDPQTCAEVSAGAATALGTDAAIMFADIMLLAEAMGIELELTADGPRIDDPIRSLAQVGRLRKVSPATDLGFILEAIGLTRTALGSMAAVVGLAGGPFTMAAYLIEGGPSRDHATAKSVLFSAPEIWAALLDRLTDATIAYVQAQVDAGAQAIQVFDSWAGSLAPADYDRAVRPWTARILDAIRDTGVPSIHYAAAGAALLERLADGADVVGIDSGQSLDAARERLGPDRAVQGNLDPTRLLAGRDAVTSGVTDVLDANGGASGHVFNTGGPIARQTDPAVLRSVVDMVHERTDRIEAAATVRPGLEVAS